MGAMTHTFYDAVTVYSGDGIIHAINMIVENNYVHHVFNGGIAAGEMSFAGDTDASTEEFQGNNIIRGNLLEYTAGITLINWETEANERHMFKNVTKSCQIIFMLGIYSAKIHKRLQDYKTTSF